MTQVTNDFRLHNWLQEAFRGDVPESIAMLLEQQDKRENVVEEMFTQLSPETKDVVQRLYEMHQADMELMYRVMGELFQRHLADHP